MSEAVELPNDVEALKGLVLERDAQIEATQRLLISQQLELEKLRFQIACLKRAKFGRSSEQLDSQVTQMQLTLEDLESTLSGLSARTVPPPPEPSAKPVRRPLPAHLPREELVHDPPCACPACGGALRPLGQDVSEMIEYIPGRYQVIRHVRPKLSCAQCQTIVQAPAPSRPIARGLAGPGFLAHVLVSKYCDHLPLYRQSQIYEREGLELDRSTLADWGRRGGRAARTARRITRSVRDGRAEVARRRYAGPGPVPGPRHDEARPAVDVRARRSAGREYGTTRGTVPLLPDRKETAASAPEPFVGILRPTPTPGSTGCTR
jgi:transposase